ncbi:MAG: hypothetical protein ACTHMC_27435, partial [Pseudobacter sp.]|uniref:hypothetical protein n=1 Tax=Pseudobacter sp. TaxID=2045420 RepID=UPI003F7F2ED1
NTNISILNNLSSGIGLERFRADLTQAKERLQSKTTFKQTGAPSLIKLISEYEKFPRTSTLVENLQHFRDTVNLQNADSVSLIFQQLSIRVSEYNSSFQNAAEEFKFAASQMVSLLPQIQKDANDPSNHLNEIIKRLVLSIVITTFFLAILRYTARLYTLNHKLMIQAEQEDMKIRKFYVTLKNTEKNQQERKAVIDNFLNGQSSDGKDTQHDVSLTKEDAGIVKELLNSLMKKL